MNRLDEIHQRGLWRDGSDAARLWRSDVEYLLGLLDGAQRLLQEIASQNADITVSYRGKKLPVSCARCRDTTVRASAWLIDSDLRVED